MCDSPLCCCCSWMAGDSLQPSATATAAHFSLHNTHRFVHTNAHASCGPCSQQCVYDMHIRLRVVLFPLISSSIERIPLLLRSDTPLYSSPAGQPALILMYASSHSAGSFRIVCCLLCFVMLCVVVAVSVCICAVFTWKLFPPFLYRISSVASAAPSSFTESDGESSQLLDFSVLCILPGILPGILLCHVCQASISLSEHTGETACKTAIRRLQAHRRR
jgi:hypothetical protein